MDNNLIVKILKKGDNVLSIFEINNEVNVSIQRKNGVVDVYSIEYKNKIPRIVGKWTIGFGDEEIELDINNGDSNVKISTF